MRYLADTQIFVWALISPEKLSAHVQNLLLSQDIFVSQISLFEIVIKQKIGKLPELPVPISVLAERLEQDNFNVLPVSTAHLAAYSGIPLLQNHCDPFDRLLLATALSEHMPLISADENFAYYKEQVEIIGN